MLFYESPKLSSPTRRELSVWDLTKNQSQFCDGMLSLGDDELREWFCAVEAGRVRITRRLLRKNPDLVHVSGEHGLTALHRAAQFGHENIARLLIDSQANVNACDNQRFTPLHAASCNEKSIAVLCMLLNAGADVNKRNNFWYSPLMEAAESANIGAVGCLLYFGANTKFRNRYGMDALEIVHWQLSQVTSLTELKHLDQMRLTLAILTRHATGACTESE